MPTEPTLPPKITFTLSPTVNFDLLRVEGDSFWMGDEKSKYASEKPVHQVHVKDFYLGKYTVTQLLWKAIMGKDPSGFEGDERPVEQVSWDEAVQFIETLNENRQVKEQLLKMGYTGLFRLPSESEWEFAARGGRYSQGYMYSGSDQLEQVGWFIDNSKNQTHEVGQLLANELGLYDMSGNVWEWCADDWHGDYDKAPDDGSAWVDRPRGGRRVVRGGCVFDDAVRCRSAYRLWDEPGDRSGDLGFRLALSLQSVG